MCSFIIKLNNCVKRKYVTNYYQIRAFIVKHTIKTLKQTLSKLLTNLFLYFIKIQYLAYVITVQIKL